MKIRPSLIDTASVTGFFVLGFLLRTWALDREAVEHFDEGVYASVLWHDGAFQAPYPALEFYAPPLLSSGIELCSVIPGLQRYAPFVPAVICGTLTVLALWLLARAWFGKAAGIFIAAIVSLSDFHIIYSRMAMTDVPCLLWIVGSVFLGTLSIQRQSFRTAAFSGFVCGLAWWTKYTGWLPLAILFSGTSLWWIWTGRKQVGALRTLQLLGTIAVTAAVTFAPWWWHLQSVGGYSAVAANHVSYLGGWNAWTQNLAAQLTCQFWLDGTCGSISLGLGMIAAGGYRWVAGECSTWNTIASNSGPQDSAGKAERNAAVRYVAWSVLLRFIFAALALTVIALRIWTPLMLACIAIGGFGGLFLWPVLGRLWDRSKKGDLSPTSEGSLPLCQTDLESSPRIDPALGLCTTLAWFVGLLLVTPLYHPYSRLLLPLLAAVWLAAAGAVSWWLESNISVARRMAGAGQKPAPQGWGQRLVSTMLTAAVIASFVGFNQDGEIEVLPANEIVRTSLGQDRTSIVLAAKELANDCVRASRGEQDLAQSPVTKLGEIVSPAAVLEASMQPRERTPVTADDRRRAKMVVYVFGEPALCFQLAAAGMTPIPVSHLSLRDPDGSEPDVPTFLVIGPHAKRTPGFWEMWLQQANSFQEISEVQYSPSEVSLLDLFTLKWRRQHDEVSQQTLELHRVK